MLKAYFADSECNWVDFGRDSRNGIGGVFSIIRKCLSYDVLFLVLIDAVIVYSAVSLGSSPLWSQLAGLMVSLLLIHKYALADKSLTKRPSYYFSVIVSLGIMACLRSMFFSALAQALAVDSTIGLIVSVLIVSVVFNVELVCQIWWHWFKPQSALAVSCVLLAVVSVAVRLSGAALIGPIPEEAYYWSYAQHPAAGYLDHPPAVAFLIYCSTHLLGQNSFALRVPAVLCWIVTAWFVFKLAVMYGGRRAGYISLAMLSVMPGFFVTGFIITPDSPLIMCWAGSLYFLSIALMGNKTSAWLMAGLCGGLGFLSKYTIGMVAIATVLMLLTRKDFRRLLLSRGPYLALAVALLVAMPNILWNAHNGWCSYRFQTSRRITQTAHFGMFEYLGSIAALVGPLILVLPFVFKKKAASSVLHCKSGNILKVFLGYQFAVPLFILGLFSVFHAPKLNWPLPAMLCGVVLIVRHIARHIEAWPLRKTAESGIVFRALWSVMLVMILLFAAMGTWSNAEGPGLANQPLCAATAWSWQRMAATIWPMQQRLNETAGGAYVVGLDKYFHTSEMAWYARKFDSCESFVAGRGIFGRRVFASGSLMWDQWRDSESLRGSAVIMVSKSAKKLNSSWMKHYFNGISDVQRVESAGPNGGSTVFYYLVGYGFHPPDDMPLAINKSGPNEDSKDSYKSVSQ